MENGVITSDKRIVASLPTIKYLLDHGAKVILCSHLGRPKGEFKPEFSLAPVAKRLGELLGQDVKMAKDVTSEPVPEVVGTATSIACEPESERMPLAQSRALPPPRASRTSG